MCIRTENLNCRRLTKHFKQERFFTFMITIYIYIYIYMFKYLSGVFYLMLTINPYFC